jgi:hypothetical protein
LANSSIGESFFNGKESEMQANLETIGVNDF